MWLDAADSSTITLNGSTVSQWNDKSGNGRHVAQGNAENQPTRISDPPRVVFDGSNDYLISTVFDFPRPFSVFFVGSSAGLSYRHAVNVGISSTWCMFAGSFDNNYATFFGNGVGGGTFWVDTAANSPLVTTSSARIFGVTNAGSGASDAIPYTNGTAQTAKGGGTFSGTSRGVSIGGYAGNLSQGWAGPIYEFLILPRVCDLTERQLIEGYLAHKWDALLGVTTLVSALPSDHPYKSAAPTL